MKINRDKILGKLNNFAKARGGMVVGKPGIGKSYLLVQLQKQLDNEEIFCLMIRIDSMFESSDEAINAELGFEKNWIDTLANVNMAANKKGVLIFDAFDAAREEKKRNGFLAQIKKAKIRLENWNVLVSVRTYDASKSKELETIFQRPHGGYGLPDRIDVEELEDTEVEQAIIVNEKLRQLYYDSSRKLKDVLKTPFFLVLLEKVVANSNATQLESIKQFHSEVQLLHLFWNMRISVSDRNALIEKFLNELTIYLIGNRSLSCRLSDFNPQFGAEDQDILTYLYREDILEEYKVPSIKISFSHNILFDYAICRYVLRPDVNAINKFIDQDPSRPFFFRPSFVYFFAQLWNEERILFWKLYKQLTESTDKAVVLFVRLVLNGTIASEYNSTYDLDPILLQQGDDNGNSKITNLLQAIRFLRSRTDKRDVELLFQLSRKLEIQYLSDFGALLDRAVNLGKFADNADCGQAARNLLTYALDNKTHKDQNTKKYLDRIGAHIGVEIVAKTFNTNPTASSILLRRVLGLIKEQDFEIQYISRLTDAVKHIIKYDITLVQDIYHSVLDDVEISNGKTQMNTGVVMTFISDRRQDFDLCGFRLQEFLPDFLNTDSKVAVSTIVDIINQHYIKIKAQRYKVVQVNFTIDGKNYKILRDLSIIWADSRFADRYMRMTATVINYISDQLITGNIDLAITLVSKYLEHCEVGFLWKQIFLLAARFPDQLFNIFIPFLVNPTVISTPEIIFEVNEFIIASGKMLTNDQIAAIENAIQEGYDDKHEYSIRTALSALPEGKLQTDWAKKIMADQPRIKNEPSVKSTLSSSAYTNEEWLIDQGVDMTLASNKELNVKIDKLEIFNSSHLNEAPPLTQHEPTWELLLNIFNTIQTEKNISEDLYFWALSSCTKTAALFLRNIESVPNDRFLKIKEIITIGYNYTNVKHNDERDDLSPTNGYSSTPKIEAVAGLVQLYVIEPDAQLQKMIREAINHINGVIRFNVITNLRFLFNGHYELYDELLFARLKVETDAFVYASLLGNVYFKKDTVTDKCIQIIEVVNSRIEELQAREHFAEAYAILLLWMLEIKDLSQAKETLIKAFEYPEFCKMIIFKLFNTISIWDSREYYLEKQKSIESKLVIIAAYVDQAKIHFDRAEQPINLVKKEHSNILEIINQLITRIYFALEATDREFRSHPRPIEENNRRDFYFSIKPIFIKILETSGIIDSKGFMLANGAHYFIQTLNSVISYDPVGVLDMIANISRFSTASGYNFDSLSIKEIIDLTEKLLTDYRYILLEDKPFQDLLAILDIYINSGWVEALQLLWRLDEVFK